MPRTATKERLTPKQQIFVSGVAAGASHLEAAQVAGYSGSDLPSLASHLARKPHVAQALARARGLKENAFTWSIESWRDEVGSCLRDAATLQDLPSRLRALELAGKHLGALEPTAPVSPAAQALITLLSDAMIAERKRIVELPLANE